MKKVMLNFFSSGFMGSWKWIASTLNPYYEGNKESEMVSVDTFIFGTLNHWCFGPDDCGNIMQKDMILTLESECNKMGQVDLVCGNALWYFGYFSSIVL